MKTVREMAADIVRREGGIADDPDDKGGFTNYGVSLVYAHGVGVRMDLNHDGVVDREDIKLVTPAIAVDLYVDDFYNKPGYSKLETHLATFLFDSAVNHGPFYSSRFAQQAAIRVGTLPKFSKDGRRQDDGVLGPTSVAAINKAVDQRGWLEVLRMAVDNRQEFFRQIVRDDPSQGKYLDGWQRRVEQLYIDIYHGK